MTTTGSRWVAVAALALAGAACSDDGGASDDATPATDAAAAADPDAVRVVTLDGVDAPGPAKYDRVTVLQQGPEDADNVLVLVPGTAGGAAYFVPVAADLVEALPGWQVWSVERRENLLEDHSRIEPYLNGEATQDEGFDYYLGWLADPSVEEHFEPPSDESVAFARDWGMDVAVGDLRAVIEAATAQGGDVVLGGHSLGGSIATAYATWDFDGEPGAADLSGLVLVDGASGPGGAPTADDAEAQLAALEAGSPFLDLVGLGLPWSAGVFNALGSSAALVDPDAPSLGWQFPLLPAALKPPMQPTNAAQYGYALDTETGPENLALVQMHLGHLAASGEPRGWEDGELVDIERAAAMFAGFDDIDGTAWYHPIRLTLDSRAVNGGIANPAQEVLDVAAVHGTELDIPIYAIETSLGAGRVLRAARAVADQSGLADDQVTLVDASDTMAHVDPLAAEPSRNEFLDTVVPFLRAIA